MRYILSIVEKGGDEDSFDFVNPPYIPAPGEIVSYTSRPATSTPTATTIKTLRYRVLERSTLFQQVGGSETMGSEDTCFVKLVVEAVS